MAKLIDFVSLLSVFFIFQQQLIQISEAKRSKLKQAKCQLDECQMDQRHFALYSFVQRAIDSNFDLSGKEIVPFLRSVEVLKRRFQVAGGISNNRKSNETTTSVKLIRDLLANETLVDALKVFESDDGRALIGLYRVQINGMYKNLACGQLRIEEAERASRKLNSKPELAKIFAKIHKNFVKKSAKKCLKHSCNSIDLSMSRLDSVLDNGNKLQSRGGFEEEQFYSSLLAASSDTNETETGAAAATTTISPAEENNGKDLKREFEQEELKLCRFFMRTNESGCQVGARDLSTISFAKHNEEDANEGNQHQSVLSLTDYFKSYSLNNNITESEAEKTILSECKSIGSLLDYNLYALKWYKKEKLIEEQKLNSRAFWCPSLGYWLQVDRLCHELEANLDKKTIVTFSYEVNTKNNTINMLQSNDI